MLDKALIAECVKEFERSTYLLQELVITIVETLEASLDERKIMAKVNGRVKNAKSLENKLFTWLDKPKKAALFETPRDLFTIVSDLAAVRVLTYTESDREQVSALIPTLFTSRPGYKSCEKEIKENDPRIKGDDNNFYRATHFMLKLPDSMLIGDNSNLAHDHCELQVTSMLAHVWNEIEHDLVYKQAFATELNDCEQYALDALGNLTESGDQILQSLMTSFEERSRITPANRLRSSQSFHHEDQLADILDLALGAKFLPRMTIDYSENTDTLLECLEELKIHSAGQLLCEFTVPRLREIKHQFRRTFSDEKQASKRVRFDESTCDLLTYCLVMNHPGAWSNLCRKNGNRRAVKFAKAILDS